MKQEEYESLINSVITWFEDIAEMCSRLTPSNVSHQGATVRGKAIRAAEWLRKRENLNRSKINN